jgi:hypothetical protein
VLTEGERFARIEEKQDAMREDTAEMKTATRETNAILLAMNERFLTVDRAEDMRKEWNMVIDSAASEISGLDDRVTKLESWRSWLTGAVAVMGFIKWVLGLKR